MARESSTTRAFLELENTLILSQTAQNEIVTVENLWKHDPEYTV